MKTLAPFFRLALAFAAFFTLAIPDVHAEKKPVEPTNTWKGEVQDEALLAGAPAVVTGKDDLAKLWKDWKIADQPPEVDFTKEIVVVLTTRGSVLRPSFRLDETGNLEALAMTSRDLRPGFRYVLAALPRAGVKSVDGKELPAK